jgi:signal peptidase
MKKFKKIYKFVILVIYIFIIMITVFNHVFIIMSGSMTPSIKIDSVILVRNIEFKSIKKGDIITFKTDNVITHRVVDKSQDNEGQYYLQTKGDANNINDEFKIYENNVIGKVVFTIPYIGKIIRFIKSWQFILTFLIVLIMLIVLKHVKFQIGEIK